jgi:uncharacterized FAD-dependent dehydrogenase
MASILIILSKKSVVYFNYFAWNMFVLLSEYLNSVKNNIYFIGDGAGKAGNIVIASATGLVSARDILNRNKKSSK